MCQLYRTILSIRMWGYISAVAEAYPTMRLMCGGSDTGCSAAIDGHLDSRLIKLIRSKSEFITTVESRKDWPSVNIPSSPYSWVIRWMLGIQLIRKNPDYKRLHFHLFYLKKKINFSSDLKIVGIFFVLSSFLLLMESSSSTAAWEPQASKVPSRDVRVFCRCGSRVGRELADITGSLPIPLGSFVGRAGKRSLLSDNKQKGFPALTSFVSTGI